MNLEQADQLESGRVIGVEIETKFDFDGESRFDSLANFGDRKIYLPFLLSKRVKLLEDR